MVTRCVLGLVLLWLNLTPAFAISYCSMSFPPVVREVGKPGLRHRLSDLKRGALPGFIVKIHAKANRAPFWEVARTYWDQATYPRNFKDTPSWMVSLIEKVSDLSRALHQRNSTQIGAGFKRSQIEDAAETLETLLQKDSVLWKARPDVASNSREAEALVKLSLEVIESYRKGDPMDRKVARSVIKMEADVMEFEVYSLKGDRPLLSNQSQGPYQRLRQLVAEYLVLRAYRELAAMRGNGIEYRDYDDKMRMMEVIILKHIRY